MLWIIWLSGRDVTELTLRRGERGGSKGISMLDLVTGIENKKGGYGKRVEVEYMRGNLLVFGM